jgi:hypothetical protein
LIDLFNIQCESKTMENKKASLSSRKREVCKQETQLGTTDGEGSGPVAFEIKYKGKQCEQKGEVLQLLF